jgi:hypothetical protein
MELVVKKYIAYFSRTPETLDRLRQTFDRWRDITINGGEGLGTFT